MQIGCDGKNYKWTNTKSYDKIYFIENFVTFDIVSCSYARVVYAKDWGT